MLTVFTNHFRLAEKKEEQDRKLKERLEERKKRKDKESPAPVEIDFGDIDPHAVPRTNKYETRTDRHETRPKSSSDRNRADTENNRKKETSQRNERDSSKDRKKETKKDINSVYDFGDF